MPGEFVLREYEASGNAIRYAWDAAGTPFAVRLTYGDLSFDELRASHGPDAVDRLAFHILASDAIRFGGERPTVLDFGPLRRFVTDAFEAVWREVLHRVSGEWRYTHDVARIDPPRLPRASERLPPPPAITPGEVPALLFSGGGKDSLLSSKLLTRTSVRHSTLAYTKTSYGATDLQRQLLARVLDRCTPYRRHELTADESAAPTAFEGETPWSVFAALPLALAHGYEHLVIGNEKSADRGNLHWDRTGEEINHQWGKSLEAERLLSRYVRGHVLPGCHYWSMLKPARDTVLFNLLAELPDDVAVTHSCNRAKPWCRRCPKCAYVLLGLAAYVPAAAKVLCADDAITAPENLPVFRQMLGLGDHTPFECIGEPEEARLMFRLLSREGHYPALERELGPVCPAPTAETLERLLEVNAVAHGIPPAFAGPILAELRRGAAAAQARIAEAEGRP